MPAAGTFTRFEKGLDRTVLTGVGRRLEERFTILALPRFSIRTRLDLGATLQALGMRDAFDPDTADLTGMTTLALGEPPRLFVAKVFHQAFITVAEKGTEASAATAIVDDGAGGGLVDYVVATFDHPFLWFIRDRRTGTILFMGRVVDPSDTTG
jgi:serpin B